MRRTTIIIGGFVNLANPSRTYYRHSREELSKDSSLPLLPLFIRENNKFNLEMRENS